MLEDVRNAARALGRIDDGPYTPTISKLRCFSAANTKTLHEACLTALVGLVVLEERLTVEIGTDSL